MHDKSELELIRKQNVQLNCASDVEFLRLANHYFVRMDLVLLATELKNAPIKYGFTWQTSEWKSYHSIDNPSVLHLEYISKTPWGEVNLDRDIVYEDRQLIAEHVCLTMPTQLQGGGISRRLNSILYTQYKLAGIKTIRIRAGLTAGGYVWALAGFYATQEIQVRKILKSAREKADANIVAGRTSTLTPALCDDLELQIDLHYSQAKRTHFPMQAFSDLDCGKEILLDTQWRGELDLAYKPQTIIFEEYLNK